MPGTDMNIGREHGNLLRRGATPNLAGTLHYAPYRNFDRLCSFPPFCTLQYTQYSPSTLLLMRSATVFYAIIPLPYETKERKKNGKPQQNLQLRFPSASPS